MQLLGEKEFITVKGLEGGIDLPLSRTCITGQMQNSAFTRIKLNSRDYGFNGREIHWSTTEEWQKLAFEAIENKGPLKDILVWNSSIYLWFTGIANDIEEGIKKSIDLLENGTIKNKLLELNRWTQSLENT